MRRVFADTSYFLALVSAADSQHAKAARWSRTRRTHIVLSEFVLMELGNALCRGTDREVFLELNRVIRADRYATVVPASTALLEDGRALFEARPDKEWSLIDCTSFEVMRAMRLVEALTTDRHFRQAGFTVLL
jgi:predicted nucleic acid-binding protein